jgi:hypothetical protein
MIDAKGSQGNWFATVTKTGESLPCIFPKYLHGLHDYHDPYAYKLGNKRDRDYVEAIKYGGRALLAQYTGSHEKGWRRVTGQYIAVYAAEDVTFSPESGLRFKARRLIE